MKLIDEKERVKINFHKTQAEKAYFLGELKENIILAVSKEKLNGKLLMQVTEAMNRKDVVLLKIRRDIPLKNIKIYIKEAEKIGIKYRLVDAVSFFGDIGLVIVSKEKLDENREILAKERGHEYREKGLPKYFADYEGKKICKKHYLMIFEKLPQYIDRFKRLTFVNKLLGEKCPICTRERKDSRK